MSITGYSIYYAGCLILWSSKLQTEIALSTTESEYIALSSAMRDVIPFMFLMKEIYLVFPVQLPTPEVSCQVFEDNTSCIKVAESPKFTPEKNTLRSNTIISEDFSKENHQIDTH